jgi:hypothetical protein
MLQPKMHRLGKKLLVVVTQQSLHPGKENILSNSWDLPQGILNAQRPTHKNYEIN